MALASARLTAEEYFALPPTEQRTQLIDAEIVGTEPPCATSASPPRSTSN